MRSNLSFLAIALSNFLLISPIQGEVDVLAGRETSWDSTAFIYTADDLEKRAPQAGVEYCLPDLQITEDKIEAKKGTALTGIGYVFSSRLTFKNKNAVDVFDKADGQIAALAKDAYEEMEKILPNKKDKQPGVMSAMFVGKEVYLTSSLKGLGKEQGPIWDMETKLLLPDLPEGVKECMTKCQQDFRDRLQGDEDLNIHRRRGVCGECIAIVQYFLKNPGKKSCTGSVFVTVNKEAGKIKVIEPCGTQSNDVVPADESWGCRVPVDVCKGRSIDDPNTKFEEYAIGKMKQKNGKFEDDAHYQKSDRYHTVDHVKLPKDLFIVP